MNIEFPEEVQPNIDHYGKIDIHSDTFKQLVKQSDWVISATCCEGCPSAVLECMAHGLVPIVTENASIDIKHYGFYFDDGKWLNNISILDKDIIASMAHSSQAETQTYYSPVSFSLRLKEAIEMIV